MPDVKFCFTFQEMAVNFGKGDKNFDQEVILKFLKFLMALWGTDLNERPQEVKRSIEVLSFVYMVHVHCEISGGVRER